MVSGIHVTGDVHIVAAQMHPLRSTQGGGVMAVVGGAARDQQIVFGDNFNAALQAPGFQGCAFANIQGASGNADAVLSIEVGKNVGLRRVTAGDGDGGRTHRHNAVRCEGLADHAVKPHHAGARDVDGAIGTCIDHRPCQTLRRTAHRRSGMVWGQAVGGGDNLVRGVFDQIAKSIHQLVVFVDKIIAAHAIEQSRRVDRVARTVCQAALQFDQAIALDKAAHIQHAPSAEQDLTASLQGLQVTRHLNIAGP